MLHPRAFKVSVAWTLALLLLGSIVHTTGSSLACPDWPTCYGTMVPVMSGGVFWEHLHRLVAGGLMLMWALATWLAYRETSDRPWIFKASLAGMGLILVQAVFGGLTVIYKLPAPVSTTHLALAFTFLSLTALLASATSRSEPRPGTWARSVRGWAVGAAVLVFAQSVLGALVRHTHAGMACPDVPLCLGQVVPPLVNLQIIAHFFHRVLALVVAIVVVTLAIRVLRVDAPPRMRRWAMAAIALVFTQIGLGIASVLTILAVVPDSLHTLGAASLLAVLVHIATTAYRTPAPTREPVPASVA